jgi:hypothetical protein
MNRIIILILIGLSISVHAQEITSCKDPKGYGYFHHHQGGLMSKSESGWSEEKITGGITTLKKLSDGKYDILIVDIRKKIISFREDGSEIVLLRKGVDDATFLHIYPDNVIELYTFWKDGEGKYRFDMLQSKGGGNLPIHKSSVMTGLCSTVKFDLIK